MNRKNIFLLINTAAPLIIGLLIYIFFYKDTYINIMFAEFFSFEPIYINGNGPFYNFITWWACDILWAYSLIFALYFCLNVFKKALLISGALSITLATIIELFQLFSLINGTFDLFDIVFEIMAILFAIIIIKGKEAKI